MAIEASTVIDPIRAHMGLKLRKLQKGGGPLGEHIYSLYFDNTKFGNFTNRGCGSYLSMGCYEVNYGNVDPKFFPF